MSFGHKSGDVRIYEYGVPRTALHHGIGGGQRDAIAQMRSRVMLWNKLVEIDREIGEKRTQILTPYPKPEHGRRVLPDEVKQALRDLEESYREPVNAACRESGCYNPNAQEVKIAWQTARKRPGGDMHFHRWTGEGRTVVFIANGLPVGAASGDNTLLRIRDGNRPGDALVSIRVRSENRQPVWLMLPIRMHRPLPADGLIKSVAAIRRFVGMQERWSVLFCVERQNGWQTQPGPRSGRVSIDLGWRRVPEGLRVATWQNDTEDVGTLVLPNEPFLWAMGKCDDLQSIRDKLWNETIATLRAWRDAHLLLPEWLTNEMRYMHLWKRKGKLVKLGDWWQEHRFKGDDIGFAIVEEWMERDTHLWEWESNLRDQTLRDRRERYRVFAADLVRRYSQIVLEDFDLSQVARVKNNGAGSELWPLARRYRQWAGVYQLRQCIESAAKREGVEVAKLPCAYSTVVCSRCGSLEKFDKARELRHTCSTCSENWDQDVNAAMNLLNGEDSYVPEPELAGAISVRSPRA